MDQSASSERNLLVDLRKELQEDNDELLVKSQFDFEQNEQIPVDENFEQNMLEKV